MLTGLVRIITGFFSAALMGGGIEGMMRGVGRVMMWGREQSAVMMGMVVGRIVGVGVSSGISSGAVGVMLDLRGTG
ncbi:PTS sugar transporter subunit IIC, partial [Bacillus sp. WP8]|uniref:PTS sugar transporter subunit IIC n=1 Tax=Bacillus sp. WP8 TaxID=756828 RepID=UPI0037BF31C1